MKRDTNLVIQAPVDPGLEVTEVQNNGRLEGNTVIWEIPELGGDGEMIDLEFQAKLQSSTEFVRFGNYQVISDNFPEAAGGIETYTFAGDSVPIWAVQGNEFSSPYILFQSHNRRCGHRDIPRPGGFLDPGTWNRQ